MTTVFLVTLYIVILTRRLFQNGFEASEPAGNIIGSSKLAQMTLFHSRFAVFYFLLLVVVKVVDWRALAGDGVLVDLDLLDEVGLGRDVELDGEEDLLQDGAHAVGAGVLGNGLEC